MIALGDMFRQSNRVTRKARCEKPGQGMPLNKVTSWVEHGRESCFFIEKGQCNYCADTCGNMEALADGCLAPPWLPVRAPVIARSFRTQT